MMRCDTIFKYVGYIFVPGCRDRHHDGRRTDDGCYGSAQVHAHAQANKAGLFHHINLHQAPLSIVFQRRAFGDSQWWRQQILRHRRDSITFGNNDMLWDNKMLNYMVITCVTDIGMFMALVFEL